MYCTQDRIYCGVCNKSVLPDYYANHIRGQNHVNILMKTQCAKSMIIQHNIGKDK